MKPQTPRLFPPFSGLPDSQPRAPPPPTLGISAMLCCHTAPLGSLLVSLCEPWAALGTGVAAALQAGGCLPEPGHVRPWCSLCEASNWASDRLLCPLGLGREQSSGFSEVRGRGKGRACRKRGWAAGGPLCPAPGFNEERGPEHSCHLCIACQGGGPGRGDSSVLGGWQRAWRVQWMAGQVLACFFPGFLWTLASRLALCLSGSVLQTLPQQPFLAHCFLCPACM